MERVACPVIFMATISGTPERINSVAAVRRKSWKMRPRFFSLLRFHRVLQCTQNWLGMRDRPELENAIEPLRELIAEYRKRYDLLSRPPAQPPEQAEAPTKNNHKKQAHEKRADDNNGGE